MRSARPLVRSSTLHVIRSRTPAVILSRVDGEGPSPSHAGRSFASLRMTRCGALVLAVLLSACHAQDDETARQLTGGDPRAGKTAIARYGCGACHEIPGVDNASGLVGPSLAKIADRVALAGQLPNHPDNMIKWIQDPQSAAPGTLKPDMNVTDRDARDIAAYLYTLRVDR
jgi:cytochrome c